LRSRPENEFAVAIRALDEVFVTHLEINAGMAKATLAAIAGDARLIHLDHFRCFNWHKSFQDWDGNIIAAALLSANVRTLGATALAR
jgi:hypothetical protein